ncbi:MAG: isochorismate synthase [Bacteroidia bacterium]|nr:isochorismate synthase [Bacteroidia bacterium]
MFDDFTALDALTTSNRSFAIYRIPGHSPALLVQEVGVAESFETLAELNSRQGFVMAPFQSNASHPVVLIRADVSVHGKSQILRYLRNLKKQDAIEHSDKEQFESKTYDAAQRVSRLDSTKRVVSPNASHKIDYALYKGAFELFQKALHAGSCEKIVLSRTLEIPIPELFSAGALFGSACETYPDAFVYLCHTPSTGIWFGSTPELLLSGEKDSWQTVALAGTRRIKDVESNWDANVDGKTSANGKKNAAWDSKNIREQPVVTAYLEKQLRIKNLIGSISEPYTVRAGQLMHIKTDFRFQMPEQGRIGDLLDFLHPTPAVCGYPKTEACRLILAHEGYDRSYYSGFAGPLHVEGKTDLYVNLRCASMNDQGLVLYAGGGLMPDSELKSEWEETEVKLQTMLSLIEAPRLKQRGIIDSEMK